MRQYFFLTLKSMTKLRAYYQWLDECPVEFDFQMDFMNKDDENCTDEMIIFRKIPNTEKPHKDSKNAQL